MDPNLIVYYVINCPIPSKIAIENRYQINFGNHGITPPGCFYEFLKNGASLRGKIWFKLILPCILHRGTMIR